MINSFKLKQLEDAEYQARVNMEAAKHDLESARKGLAMARTQIEEDSAHNRSFWKHQLKTHKSSILDCEENYENAKEDYELILAKLERGRAEYERIQQLAEDVTA